MNVIGNRGARPRSGTYQGLAAPFEGAADVELPQAALGWQYLTGTALVDLAEGGPAQGAPQIVAPLAGDRGEAEHPMPRRGPEPVERHLPPAPGELVELGRHDQHLHGAALGRMAADEGAELFIPPLALCTDNAAMAAQAVEKWRRKMWAPPDLDARPNYGA